MTGLGPSLGVLCGCAQDMLCGSHGFSALFLIQDFKYFWLALRAEYLAIVDAGFILQIDDPSLPRLYRTDPSLSMVERRKGAAIYIKALNLALRGIPAEKVRYHGCYGINEGPRIFDIGLRDIVDLMLKVNAQAISFEAANARHAALA